MSLPITTGDILAARIWSQLDEQGAVNTLNYVCISNTGAGATDSDLAASIDTGVSTFYRGLYPATVEYRGVQVYCLQRLGLLTAAAPVSSLAGAGVGTASGVPMPRNTCAILSYNAGLRGPAYRGRIFLPFLSTVWQSSNGRPTTAFAVFANSWLTTILATLVTGTSPNTSTLVWSLLKKNPAAVPTDRGRIVFAESANKFGQLHKRGDYGRANASPI